MIEIKSILCPVDLSETSQHAYDYATLLARWYKSSLTVIEMIWVGIPSVRPTEAPLVLTPQIVGDFNRELEKFVHDHTPQGLRVDTVLREGPMAKGILDEAANRVADLIVMGTHGRSGFDRVLLGSVTEKVLRKATCPVLTVPPRAARAPLSPQPFKTIVCPVDFSPASLRAVRYALLLAQESEGRLVLVHVFDWAKERPMAAGIGPDISAGRRKYEEDAIRELRAAVPDDARSWCSCSEITAIGRPYEEILRVAAEQRADLIVTGVHGRNVVDLTLFGSTTNQLVRRATCPVLTIRP